MLLNNRPLIFVDESMCSYIYRLAQANSFNSISIFAEFLGLPESQINNNDFSRNALTIISDMIGSDFSNLTNHTFNVCKEFNFKEYRNGRRVKYCPDCMRENKYHRINWFLWPITVCLKHNCLLVDTCCFCNSYLNMKSLMNGICSNCRLELTFISDKKSDLHPYMKESQELFDAKLQDINADHIGDLNFKDYINLIKGSFFLLEGLPSFLANNRNIEIFLNKKNRHRENENMAHTLANIHWMYKDFPFNFHKVLGLFNQKNIDVRYEQKTEFEKVIQHKAFETIKISYIEYWIRALDEGVIRKDFSVFKHFGTSMEYTKFVAKEEIKIKYAVTNAAINRILTIRNVPNIEKKQGSIKRFKIHREHFERALKEKEGYISRKDAAEMLGVSKGMIAQLVQSKHLKVVTYYNDIGLVDTHKIKQILKLFSEYILDEESNNMISMKNALVKYSVCGLKLVDIIHFVKRGLLKTYNTRKMGGLKTVYFDVNNLRSCVEELKDNRRAKKGYFLSEVMEKFKMGEKAIKAIVERKIIVPEKIIIQKDDRKHYLFNKDIIDDFITSHCSIKDAARLYGISEITIRRAIKKGDLIDELEGACRSQILSKKKIAQFLEQNMRRNHNASNKRRNYE